MVENVIKRNGKIQQYNSNKIRNAVLKTMNEVGTNNPEGTATDIMLKVEQRIDEEIGNTMYPHVETIQDMVEEVLIEINMPKVAKQYILYRDRRSKARKEEGDTSSIFPNSFISKYKHQENPFPTDFGEFIYYRTYSRWKPTEERREYWWETIKRAVEYNTSLAPTSVEEAKKLYDNVYNMRTFLAGRTLWTGGTKASKKYPMSNYNCASMIIDEFKKYKELFYLLMIGAGVGVRVLPEDVDKLPKVRTNIEIKHEYYDSVPKGERQELTSYEVNDKEVRIIVGDSKEAWTQALDLFLRIVSRHDFRYINKIYFNYDNVRPKGERLKTFGGTASGHGSIKKMFDKIGKLFNRKSKDRTKLEPIDCLDIANIIGENVVSGGVRRTSEIGLFDKNDDDILEAKNNLYTQQDGEWVVNKKLEHRQMSNNSIVYYEKPTREQLHWQIEQMRYSGEPGFINAEEITRRRDNGKIVNPCFTSDMELLTDNGYKTFEELSGQRVNVINKDGEISNGKVWSNGTKDIVEIKFYGRDSIKATPDHIFMTNEGKEVEASRLEGYRIMPFVEQQNDFYGEFVKFGFIQGDGGLGRLRSKTHKGIDINLGENDADVKGLFDVTEKDLDKSGRVYYTDEFTEKLEALDFSSNKLSSRELPSTFYNWSYKEQISFIKGLFSANGSVIGNTGRGRITLKSTCKNMLKSIKEFLEDIGYNPYITTNKSKITKFSNGEYRCQESYDLNLGQYDDKVRFYKEIGFVQDYKNNKLKEYILKTAPKVTSVSYIGEEEVFDFSEPKTHWGVVEGVVVHNCAEILLDDRGMCNLVSLNTFAFVNEGNELDREDMFEAQRLNTRAAYRMALVEFELPEWDYVNKRDRLIGLSLTGWQDMVNKLDMSKEEQKELLQDLREVANDEAEKVAREYDDNVPVLVTTVKPEGCITKDHLRVTDQGIISIDEIEKNIDNLEENKFININGYSRDDYKISQVYNNKVKDIIKLTLKNGRKIELSKEHPLSIDNNWVEAQNIKVGDELDFELGQYKKETHSDLELVSTDEFRQGDNGVIEYNLPNKMDEDLSWLIGAYMANGSFPNDKDRKHQHRIKFHCEYKKVHEKVQRIWEDKFGVKTNIIKSNDRNSYTQDFGSVKIRKWLKYNKLDKKYNTERSIIPHKIRTSSKKDIINFIIGYADNDGCFSNDSFCIDSIDDKFIRHLQEVGEAVGLSFSFIVNSERSGYSDNTMYKNHLSRVYSKKEVIEYINKVSIKAQNNPIKNSEGKRYVTNPYTVIEKEIVKDKKTYGVKVDKVHWYYQGGLKSHNTQTQMPTVSSGLHFNHSPYYIRRVRINADDPLAHSAKEHGWNVKPEVGQDPENPKTAVIEFPIKAPKGKVKKDVSAIEQLEVYKMFMENYVDHNASITVHVRNDEWDDVEEWMWNNWDTVVGISFISLDDNFYDLMPYEEITKEEYKEMIEDMEEFKPYIVNYYEKMSNERELGNLGCETGVCPVR